MRRHHAHRVARLGSIAHDLHLAAIEPVEEALQRGRRAGLEIERGGQQFLDRIARLLAEPLEQPPPSVERARQQFLQELIGRGEIRPRQHRVERREQIAIPRRQMPPQAPGARHGAVEQFLLRPADQRRDEQAGKAEIVVGLEHEADRREQVLYRQRRVEPQAIDPRHRHALGIEPRDKQLRQLAAPLDEDHHVLRAQRAALALQHQPLIEPRAYLPGDAGGILAHRIVDPLLLAVVALARPGADRRP